MKTIIADLPRFRVFKNEDIEKHLNDRQKENLEDIICDIHAGRISEGKDKWPNIYLVLNIDEPYAQQVWGIMSAHGHTPCCDCHESKKEMFCKPGSCLWHGLLSGMKAKNSAADEVVSVLKEAKKTITELALDKAHNERDNIKPGEIGCFKIPVLDRITSLLETQKEDYVGGLKRTVDTIKIRMRKNVRIDFPLGIIGLLGEKPGTILRADMEYQAISNKNGAISGLCDNGEYLGVKPGEFDFIEAPEWVLKIHGAKAD